MSRYPWTRFSQTRTGRLLSRLPWYRSFIARRVWAEFLSDPEARAGLERTRADVEAGRMYEWHGGDTIPSPSWKPDDPIQPPGWHHDGTQWVRDPSEAP